MSSTAGSITELKVHFECIEVLLVLIMRENGWMELKLKIPLCN